MSEHTDPLYDGLRRGEKTAIKRIYATCRPQIIRYVTMNSGTPDEGHDVFVTAVEVLYLKLQTPDFIGSAAICTYLYSVAKNTWLKILRKKSKQNEVTLPEGMELIAETNIERSLITRNKHTLFREKLNQLTPRCQKILRAFFEKKSMTEIAEIMNFKSSGTAKKEKFKCQQAFIQLIKNDPRFDELYGED